MRELAIQASNDTLTDVERGYVDGEFQALIGEIDRIADVTNYNGMKLIDDTVGGGRFGETGGTDVLWIDAGSGTENSLDVNIIEDLTAGTLGVDALSVDTQDNASGAIGDLDTALDTVNSSRAAMGAAINRLDHALNNLFVSETNQQAAESVIRDVDFAYESSQYTRNQILVQSSTAMLAQANMVSTAVLSLLK